MKANQRCPIPQVWWFWQWSWSYTAQRIPEYMALGLCSLGERLQDSSEKGEFDIFCRTNEFRLYQHPSLFNRTSVYLSWWMSEMLDWEWSPGGGHGNPFQCSCLENPMDRRSWPAAVHRVTKSQYWVTKHTQCVYDNPNLPNLSLPPLTPGNHKLFSSITLFVF